ncbi:type II toxin-antitoxin system VapB family antitoxin [Nonomuraea sp. NPDC001636]|uniref:type II toxin-antitoxin system VapB family antitoxin n=1 Tax=Nonomuraea sp. NPDC001636 TaxID=3154391 RepID=UPI003325D0D9
MRTVIDIDTELLETAQARLGSPTVKETVRAALQAVVDRGREWAGAVEAFEFWRTEGSPDLPDPEIRQHVWRPQD